MCRDLEETVRGLLRQAEADEPSLAALCSLRFVKELGKGGMGAVYLLQAEADGKAQALKVMLPGVDLGTQAQELFLREIENTRALRHPNVVQFISSGRWRGTLFFTMEYCEGGSAADLAAASAGLAVPAALDITLQVLNGLEYAHHANVTAKLADGSTKEVQGIVHRDLKPWNILISGSGDQRVAKLADFGLSKAFEVAGLTRITRTGDVGGTPPFMPRQQFINFRYARPEVDVWAIAASLYWMLTGRTPRECPPGKSWGQVIKNERPIPILERDGSIPAPLAAVLDEALEDSGKLKYQTAASLAKALKEATALLA